MAPWFGPGPLFRCFLRFPSSFVQKIKSVRDRFDRSDRYRSSRSPGFVFSHPKQRCLHPGSAMTHDIRNLVFRFATALSSVFGLVPGVPVLLVFRSPPPRHLPLDLLDLDLVQLIDHSILKRSSRQLLFHYLLVQTTLTVAATKHLFVTNKLFTVLFPPHRLDPARCPHLCDLLVDSISGW